MSFPRRVDIETTNFCPLACPMCPRQFMTRRRGFMEYSLVEKIVKEVADKKESDFDHMAVHQIGEPLLHPRIVDIVKLIVDNGLTAVLTTSGFLLKKDIARRLMEVNLQHIAISLDSLAPEQYEKIRKGSKLDVVIKNIDDAIETHKKLGSRTAIDLVTIEMFDTVGQAEMIEARFGEAIRSIGGNIISKKFSQWGGSIKDLASPETTEAAEPCSQMNISLIVQWDGNASICCLDYDGKTNVGNVYEESIEDIWNGPRFNEFRRRIMAGDTSTPLCGQCHHLWKSK